MKTIYLDNAATTSIRQEVIDEMVQVMRLDFGNPSSTHSVGRSAKAIIENGRKSIASLLNCNAQEILFTSSATEATNWILRSVVKDHKVKRIITSRIEHHATLYTIQALQAEYDILVDYIPVLNDGSLNYESFSELVSKDISTLVSIMHINNETGVVNDIEKIGIMCRQNSVLFHCDTVQSIGKIAFNLKELPVDFLVASAHKFHGPKGIGFAFIRKGFVLQPIIYGGEQEKGWRAGTEAVHQIAGLSKSLQLSYEHLEMERNYIIELKNYCWSQLQIAFPAIKQNGSATFYNILNVLLPFSAEKTAMILFYMDMKGVAVSRGSACQSGSNMPSHVLIEMLSDEELTKPSLRISFSHNNTKADIDYLIKVLQGL